MVKKKKPTWAGHVMRRTDNRRINKVKEWQPRNRRSQGRQGPGGDTRLDLEYLPGQDGVHKHQEGRSDGLLGFPCKGKPPDRQLFYNRQP